MNKYLNVIEETVVAIESAVTQTEPAKLDDLSLALVGGGNCVVTF